MPTHKEVKEAREQAGLTQSEAGKVVQVSARAWQNWELKVNNMPPGLWELFLLKTKSARKKNIST